MIDQQGYRANVAIILHNRCGQVLWAQRSGLDGWQFPQGGIRSDETPEQAMYRELREEIGLGAQQVQIVAASRDWLHYHLPETLVRRDRHPVCVGQKQLWYLLALTGTEEDIDLNHTQQPEFCRWCWVDYWHPLREVVSFKRPVYRAALEGFAAALTPPPPGPRTCY